MAGMQGLPHLAVTRWWTTKGVFATKLRDTEEDTNWLKPFCASNATEPGSDAKQFRHHFTGFVGH